MRTRIATANARKTAQPPEGGVYQSVAEALTLSRLEKRLIVLIPSFRGGQIFPKEPNHIRSQRDKSGFVELRTADGNHTVIQIHVCQLQPKRFTNAQARSVEEQQQGTKRDCGYPALHIDNETLRPTTDESPGGSRYAERRFACPWEPLAASG